MPLPSIDGYTVSERLGTGGFASVYAATRLADDESVAIKVLHEHTSDEADLRRFEREAQTMRAFNGHPNIVSVFESGITESGSHYAVLEFVGGGSVRDLLASQRALHWSEALRIGGQVAAALDVAHRSGVLHRDVKPANILLDQDNVKLSDFGIARLVGQSQVTAAQSIIGTLAYTPPEVFHGSAFDGRGDIYQLGISMYEMLLGRPPFSSATSDNKATIIRRILDKPAPPLEQFDVPAPISDLLEQVLAKDPADRPQTAQRFGELLAEIETELGVSPTIPIVDRSGEAAKPLVDVSDPDGSATIAMEPPFRNEPAFPAQHEADLTVVGQSSDPHTSVMPVERPQQPAVAEQPAASAFPKAEALPPAQAAVPAAATPPVASTPPVAEPEVATNRGRWLAALLALLVVGGVGAAVAFTQLDTDGTTDDATSEEDATTEETEETEAISTAGFAPVATEVFSLPETSDGIAFASVANSQGLTIVGSVGDGEQLTEQRSVVWTFGSSGFSMRRDVTENAPHRMWSIGVIEGQTFLAVGDAPGRDGVAWTGDRASAFTPVTNPDFTGDDEDYLRTSIHDPSLGDTFLVGGRRTEGSDGVPAIWEVSGNPNWGNPEWTLADIGSDSPGVVNDIAVDGDIAAAVGMETVDGQNRALMKIRQDGVWSNLIGPVEDVELWGVTILDERIIAVGVQGETTPVALIADTLGTIPRRHALPIRSGDGGVQSGIARSIITLDNGQVLAVGDVDRSLDPGNAEADIEKDGAIWELIPGDELGDDLWTTRASSDLVVDGFVELWAIDQYQDTVYVFGRTETEDGRRPAGAWTLDLS